MKKAQYLALKAQLEAELQSAQATADGVRRRLDALNVVWSEILCAPASEMSAATPCQNDTADDQSPLLPAGAAFSERIDDIALMEPKSFNVHTIIGKFACIGQTVNRTTVVGRLQRLVEDGKLELVQKGQGRRPSTFQVKREGAIPQ